MSEDFPTPVPTVYIPNEADTPHVDRKILIPDRMGIYCGGRGGFATDIGRREQQQDACIGETFTIGDNNYELMGVFDGFQGDSVSRHISQHIVSRLREVMEHNPGISSDRALTQTFVGLQNDLLEEFPKQEQIYGSTATVVLIDSGSDIATIAHIGDSLAVVDTRPGLPLTDAHVGKQRASVKKAFMVPAHTTNLANNEILERATPQIVKVDRTKVNRLLLLVDGIVDGPGKGQGDMEAIWAAANRGKTSEQAAQLIVDEAYQQGSGDNLTAIVVDIGKMPTTELPEGYSQRDFE